MGLKLFELEEKADVLREAIELQCDPETGEELDDVEGMYTRLKEVEIQREQKLLWLGALYKEIEAEADAVSAQAKKLVARQKLAERKAERLKLFIAGYLNEGEKLSDERVTLSWRNSKRCEITDESMLPKKFLRIKEEPDKSEITKALKSGVIIPGASMVSVGNLQVK